MTLPYISKLNLLNFRNYRSFSGSFNDKVNVVYGKNGVGKTNILEAISLLSPGKGFRNSTLSDISIQKTCAELVNKDNINYNFQNMLWSIFSEIENSDHFRNISVCTSLDQETQKVKRSIQVNQKPQKHTFLSNIFSVIWLTPYMNTFFNGPASARRKFLDKIVLIINPEHSKRVTKYEFVVRERMKLMTENPNFDKQWLSALERKIAELGIAIAVARNEAVHYLNKVFQDYYFHFPKLHIRIDGYFENLIQNKKAIECEERYIEELHNNRESDARVKRTAIGVHKSDIEVTYLDKNMKAKFCSTGEQKLILVSLTLAKAIMCNMLNKSRPILLLDEICSHLDDTKRQHLFDEIQKLNAQSFLTGINKELFNMKNANYLEL